MSEELPIVMVLSVMPVVFLNPAQDAPLADGAAPPAPFVFGLPPVDPVAVDPVPVDPVPVAAPPVDAAVGASTLEPVVPVSPVAVLSLDVPVVSVLDPAP
jgi:hypothetical protein